MSENFKVSPSLEDYLEAIYFLKKKNQDVRVTDVAEELNISKPSVNKAINILKKQQLVSHEHYGLLDLTDQGYILAENVARRHHVIKRFLKELLNIDEETAEKEACLIEHSISPETLEKLSAFVDNHTVKPSVSG